MTMKIERDDNATRISVFMPWGFHGDQHLLRIVDQIAPHVNRFVETGTEAGSTVAYMARMYPHIECYTCEADPGTHELAKRNTANIPHIHHACADSRAWLGQQPTDLPTLFWLDAHSHGFGCPIGEEVAQILRDWTGGYILMDDFEVPGQDGFGFDWYDTFGKVNWQAIDAALQIEDRRKITQALYPNYAPYPGVRGWMLLAFGDAPRFEITEDIREAEL